MLATVLLVSGCGLQPAPSPTPNVTDTPPLIRTIEPPFAIKDFALTDQNGAKRTLADFRGKFTLIYFGYTHCPDFCPISLAKFVQVKQALGETAQRLNIVFISVDGARDTPSRMAEYLKNFDSAFIGLTGDEGSVRALGRDVGAMFTYNKKSPDDKDYSVDHTVSYFLLDSSAQLLRIYDYNIEIATLAADLREYLRKASS